MIEWQDRVRERRLGLLFGWPLHIQTCASVSAGCLPVGAAPRSASADESDKSTVSKALEQTSIRYLISGVIASQELFQWSQSGWPQLEGIASGQRDFCHC